MPDYVILSFARTIIHFMKLRWYHPIIHFHYLVLGLYDSVFGWYEMVILIAPGFT